MLSTQILEKADVQDTFIATRTISLNGTNLSEKRKELLNYFHKTFSLYESIFECLINENVFYMRPNPLRHPLIFYYGHTAVFFINKLNVAGLVSTRIDPKLESMLAIGVDEMSWDDLHDDHYDWPTPSQVHDYREKTRTLVDQFIRSTDFSLPINWQDPMWIILMGIEHERIHLETTSVLIRELPIQCVKPHPVWSNICLTSNIPPTNELLPVKGGPITLGKSKNNPLYGWDNEYGVYTTQVEDFNASKYLVSNKEFLDFVNENGYSQEQFWDKEGWQWVQSREHKLPTYWLKVGNYFKYRTMLEIIDMPWDWPVDVNHYEAKAFCNWKSTVLEKNIRLPTEAEWYTLRKLVDTDQPYWDYAPGNINLEYEMSACPVNRHAFANGFYDIIGNVWQWTETPIDCYEGFTVHPAYDDFSTPTFDGKHFIFKGGCWISTGNYAIKDSRYAFRRHFFQHAGLRYVEAAPMPKPSLNVYETDTIVSQYIEFHYGESYFNVPNFPVTCAQYCNKLMEGLPTRRALDIGCAAGRASFELAKIFNHVDAVDFSARIIQAPTNLQKRGCQRYTLQEEGELVTYKEIRLEGYNYHNIKDRVTFLQGDACNLNAKFTNYDLVFAGNLIDRLYEPAKFLKLIKDRICPGGLLVITSPYTWLTEFTKREYWLGGFKANTGESYTTLDSLQDHLTPEFELLQKPIDIPFVIRETKRKYQHTLAEMTVWKKKD
ncbi:5-histidylcysteine sulfoxide synthase [Zooshikella sp. RANM57]|uniref:5-histidylcysteine sulfoxide synthase n=1 Tax=Zooshikella sp. RANM57 TaxID=3425863 RepID=UPI003D6DEF91